jgi:hypothetical protein
MLTHFLTFSRIISVVVHDDIISRVTPQSIRWVYLSGWTYSLVGLIWLVFAICRILLNDMMKFREQIFRHVQQDWNDVIARAASVWSPRLRDTMETPALLHVNRDGGVSDGSSFHSGIEQLGPSSRGRQDKL